MFSANSSQVSEDRLYVEDVFSTWLYTGNGGTQTITNGIDLAGKGGMIWLKNRTQAASHFLFDTSRGPFSLTTNNTLAAGDYTGYQSFTSSGFSIGATGSYNLTGDNYASWTFRKAPKFFDVVTYTGNGVSGRQIAHNLGVAPGCIIIKCYSRSGDYWLVYHRGLTSASYSIRLESTAAQTNNPSAWASTAPTDTVFTVGDNSDVNSSGATYVAYLFAHDTTSDGIIQCGSYTGTGGAGNTINLGWEPQWLLIKSATESSFWQTFDNMRGIATGGDDPVLFPNATNAEGTGNRVDLTATGFSMPSATLNASGQTYIYIAIRRGPMRTPTLGTSVFAVNNNVVSDATKTTSGIITDLFLERPVKSGANPFSWVPRLTRGYMDSNSTAVENVPGAGYFAFDYMDGFLSNLAGNINPGLFYSFKRAPGFFDEVCYTGTGVARTVNHSLGVAPELMIVKGRSLAGYEWMCYHKELGAGNYIDLSTAFAAAGFGAVWNSTTPTSTVFSVGTYAGVNQSSSTFVAYLFASCPGVSKVGSYTGNGSSQTINCGFAAGARFVMIKRTNATGDWYVWDTARGIVAANDPHLSLNTTAAEVTTDDTIDTDSSGFVVNQVAATNVNVSSATYIYLAIA